MHVETRVKVIWMDLWHSSQCHLQLIWAIYLKPMTLVSHPFLRTSCEAASETWLPGLGHKTRTSSNFRFLCRGEERPSEPAAKEGERTAVFESNTNNNTNNNTRYTTSTTRQFCFVTYQHWGRFFLARRFVSRFVLTPPSMPPWPFSFARLENI